MKRILSQIGTFVTVTLVTLLVWLYAEDANIESHTGEAVRVQFILPEGVDGIIDPIDPITVLVDFDGSNGQFQQFDEARGEVIKVVLPIDQTLDQQILDIDLRDQIEQADALKDLGINVTSVSPERAEVSFEKIIDLTLDVRIQQRTGAIKLASATFINPDEQPRVTLQVPAGLASQLGNIDAIAWVNEDDVVSLEKGTQKQITVPLELPGALNELPRSISSIDLLVTVADDRDTIEIDRRTILLSYPPSINERYIIELDEESETQVTLFKLEGPREEIEKIKANPNTPSVRATVWLSNEEVEEAASNGGTIESKAVEIVAPEGVSLSSDVVRVTIKVTPREATPAP